MIGNVKIERDLNLEFEINHVKECLDKVIPLGSYTLQSKNDILNTYRISKLSGLEFVNINIVLKKIDDKSTNINLSCIENIRNSGHEMIVNEILDNFLERLSKSLVGMSDEEIKKVTKKPGCFGVIIFFVLSVSSLLVFNACNSEKKDRENFMTGLINQRKAIENSLDSIVKIKLPENKYYIDTAAYQSKESDLEDEKILNIQMALWKERDSLKAKLKAVNFSMDSLRLIK